MADVIKLDDPNVIQYDMTVDEARTLIDVIADGEWEGNVDLGAFSTELDTAQGKVFGGEEGDVYLVIQIVKKT